jgi:hypothetical protein
MAKLDTWREHLRTPALPVFARAMPERLLRAEALRPAEFATLKSW